LGISKFGIPNFGNSNADPLNPLIGLVDDIGLVVVSSMALILKVGAARRHLPDPPPKAGPCPYDNGPLTRASRP
jgi:hypothetical protein